MADVHRIPDASEAERVASEWIARLNADDVSADDRARFEAWRTAHPMYARAYEALSATWDQCTAARPIVRAVSFAESMNEAAVTPRRQRRRAFIAAAVAVMVATTGWLYFGRLAPDATFSTTSGEHATISLADGSTLELNSNSLAHVVYSERMRVIHLDRGEAFFKVAHDVHRPFWVVAGRSWVRAVGTAFDVYLGPTAVQVTVGEGTVKVGAVNSLVDGIPTGNALAQTAISVLTAGQQADLTSVATATRRLSAAELARSMAWRDGTLYFENQPLGEIVDELGRYTALQLIVDEKLRTLPMGGTFQASPQGTEALLQMLEQGFGLTVRRVSDRVYIEGLPDKRPAVEAQLGGTAEPIGRK
jgi:transmembrane sensor